MKPVIHSLYTVVYERRQLILIPEIVRALRKEPKTFFDFRTKPHPQTALWLPWLLAPLLYSLRRDDFYQVTVLPPYAERDITDYKQRIRYAYALTARAERLQRPALLLAPYLAMPLAIDDAQALQTLARMWNCALAVESVPLVHEEVGGKKGEKENASSPLRAASAQQKALSPNSVEPPSPSLSLL